MPTLMHGALFLEVPHITSANLTTASALGGVPGVAIQGRSVGSLDTYPCKLRAAWHQLACTVRYVLTLEDVRQGVPKRVRVCFGSVLGMLKHEARWCQRCWRLGVHPCCPGYESRWGLGPGWRARVGGYSCKLSAAWHAPFQVGFAACTTCSSILP